MNLKNIQTHEPAGVVLGYDDIGKRILVDVRNHVKANDIIELLLPRENVAIDTRSLLDDDGKKIDQAHAGDQIYLPLSFCAPKGALLRKQVIRLKTSHVS